LITPKSFKKEKKFMTILVTFASCSHRYHGDSNITFVSDEQKGLSVTIDTKTLHIRSVQPEDVDNYAALFGDKGVMEKYATGQTKTKEEIGTRVNDLWVKRWQENDPFSGLAVFKKETGEFLGHVILGHGDEAGESEIAYLFHRCYWKQGYGSEAVASLVKEYAPAIVRDGYSLEGKSFQRIVATARPDNPASCKILEKIGMHTVGTETKFGFIRNHYEILISELL
jgi:RimJ/RimL family protein N-acetyltransferase